MDICIVGGGPAGVLTGIFAKRNNNNCNITILEKNEKIGKKLYITGKGRCNITNFSDVDNLIENTIGNPYFMYSSYYSFTSQDCVNFFEKLGVKTKVERGNRVFPITDKSSSVVNALKNELDSLDIKVSTNTEVIDIIKIEEKFKVVTNCKELIFDKVVIATGGLSYPVTGSTGYGYKVAKSFGHKVTKLYPSLVPLQVQEESNIFCKAQGLSLKNVKVSVFIDNKKVFEELGEMMFTHFGVTGPLILTASRYFVGMYHKECKIKIDLKPALDTQSLDKRLLRDFEKFINKEVKNAFDELLPQKLIPIFIKYIDIDERKKVNEITKEERKKIVDGLKGLELFIKGDNGYSEAVITAGGIEVKEVDPSTMESKLISNLFFVGEVLDVDCLTGGYNLQVAYSTAFLCGQAL
ncbi:MAG: NAD(P)/FAD-dependent oxidoreductase [Lachnospirales bacterium]